MAKQNRNTLKGYFETGKKPTEGQYANLIDSHALLDGENTGSLNIKGNITSNGDITSTEITASGIISSSANIIADQFIGDGSLITGITSSLINISAQTASLNSGSLLVSGTLFYNSASALIRLGIETTGSIIPEGNGVFDLGSPTNYFKDTFVSRSHAINVTTTDLETSNIITGHITASQSIIAGVYVKASELIITGNITASGDISASGNIYSKGLLTTEGNSAFGDSLDDTHTFTGAITSSGNISASGDIITHNLTSTGTGSFEEINLNDGKKIKLGTSDDLSIYHDGSNSFIHEAGIGDLILKANNIQLTNEGGEKFVDTTTNGSVDIYYDNVVKFTTTATGVNITGDVTASGNISANGHLTANHITASGNISSSGNINANQFTGIFNGAISSSDQIATAITGAFIAPSASISTRLTTAESELSNTLISSSNQIRTAISGAFTSPSASISTRLTTAEIELAGTLVSSSNQIATEISGALGTNATLIRSLTSTSITGSFTAASSSFDSRLTTAETELSNTLVSSSNQIATEISGALGTNATLIRSLTSAGITGSFTAASSSFDLRLTTAETELSNTLVSSSAQIALEISGAFVAPSASISTRLSTAESELSNTLVSSSAQIALEISGALGTNATLIRSLTSAGITGSFTAASSSFSTRLVSVEAGSTSKPLISSSNQIGTAISGALSTTAIAALGGGYYSSSLQTFTSITASGNISASSTIQGLTGSFNRIEMFGAGTNEGFYFDNDGSESRIEAVANDLVLQTIRGNDDIELKTSSSAGGPTTKMFISSSGNVGIGTSTPGEKLEVIGNISASGEFIGASANITNITASGAISASHFIGMFNGALSSSDQIATEITGAFTAPSASISTRLSTAETELSNTLISSSAQIADDISGSLSSVAIVALGASIVSSSNQIGTAISGAFTAPSASFSTRVAAAETELAGTLISSSNQIATEITGAFVAPSASISTRLTTAEAELGNTLISSSNQIATSISGALSNTAIAALGGGYYSSSLQTFTNITASGNISASGNIIASQITSLDGLTTTGTGSFGEINLDDNNKIKLGTGDDLLIYHSGDHSFITHGGSGDLKIFGANIELGNTSGVLNFKGIAGGASNVYHNGNEKLATTTTGVNVTGDVTASGHIKTSATSTGSFGKVEATSLSGDGSGLTNLTAEWDGSHVGAASMTGSLGMSGSITQVNGIITTDYINVEKAYMPGQGVGTMQIGSTFGVGETLDVVGNIHASNKVLANQFITNDSTAGVVGMVSSSAQIATEISGAFSNAVLTNVALTGHITASGNISASGNIITQNITASGVISSSVEFIAPSANILNITSSQAISSSGTITGLTGSYGRLHATVISSSGVITVGTITPDTITNVNTTFVTASIVSSSTHIDTPKVIASKLESTGSLELLSSASVTLRVSSSIGSTDGGNIFIKDGLATQIHITGSEVRTTSNMVLSSSGDISLMADGNDITLGGDGKEFLKYSHDFPGTDDVTITNLRPGDVYISSSNALTLDAAGGDLFIKDHGVTSVSVNTTAGHITASGAISASGTLTGLSGSFSRLGIGTSTPTFDLDVVGSTNGIIRAYGPSIGRLSLQNSTRHYSFSVQGSKLLMYDETGGATRVVLDNSGKVGIGNSSPTKALVVAGSISSSANIYARSGTGSFGEINLDDNNKIKLGTSDDLSIYHDGSNSYISETGTGDLNVIADNFYVKKSNGHKYIYGVSSTGQVRLFYGDNLKLATQNTGVDITGDITSSGIISGSVNVIANTGSFGILSGSIVSGTFVGDGSGLTGAGAPAGTISSSYYYNTFQLSGSETYTSGSTAGQLLGLAVTGSILPGITSDGTTGFDLGSPTKVWRDLWLSPASLKFVSASGEITRFEQKDVKNIREGKPVELSAAVEGFTKLNRPEAVMSAATDKTYMDLNSAGRFKFKVGDDSTTPVDLMDMRFADGGNTIAKNYFKIGQGTTDINLSGSFITTNANITASAVNGVGGNISASGTITGLTGSFSQLTVSTIIGGSPVTFTDNIIVPNISASGIISSSTTIQGLTGSFVHFVAPTLSNVNSSTHITASGNISASGKIYAEDFYIGNEQFTDNSAAVGNFNIGASGAGSLILKHISSSGNYSGSAISNIETGGTIKGYNIIARNNITASGIISASGNIINTGNVTSDGTGSFGRIHSTTDISASGNITNTGNIINTGYITTTHVTASGNISSSGNLSTAGDLTIIGKSHFTGDITASGNISASGTIYADNFQSAGGDDQISITDDLNLTGHFTSSGNISSSGNFTNTGNITSNGTGSFSYVKASGNISSSGTVFGITGSFSHLAGDTTFGTVTQTTSSITFLTSSTGVITSSVTFVPNVTNTFDLGSSTKQFKDIYIDGVAYIDNIAETVSITTASFARISSSLLPTIDNTFNLGSTGQEWKDLYVDGTGNIDIVSSSAVEVIASSTTASLHTSGAYSKVILESLPTITNGATTVVMNSSGQLFQSSNISASGFISTQTSVTASIVSASSTIIGVSGSFVHLNVLGGTITSSGNIINTGYISTTHITASGNISSSGNISAATGTGSFGRVYAPEVSASGTVQGLTGSFTYAVIPTISSSGTITAEHLYSSDDAVITDTLTVGTITNVNTTHITSSGDISSSGNLYANNIILPSSEDLGNQATASLGTYASYFSTGQAETANLEDGVEGQTKVLAMRSDGGNMVVTVSNAGWKTSGDGQITFDTLGDACTLQFINGHWFCIGNNGCVFA
mgnify:CR=1 FL=1